MPADPDTSGSEQLSEERVREILQEVDLEYLADRDGAMTEEVPWDDILSLVSCHDIAAIWVAFFSRWQRYRC